jgi:hypothetical protein
MMGERDQRGIIPRFAQRMWEMIATKPNIEFKVEISYFEIYAEQIFDLLVSYSPVCVHLQYSRKFNLS